MIQIRNVGLPPTHITTSGPRLESRDSEAPPMLALWLRVASMILVVHVRNSSALGPEESILAQPTLYSPSTRQMPLSSMYNRLPPSP